MLQRQVPGESSVVQPMHHGPAHLLLAYSAGGPPRSTGKSLLCSINTALGVRSEEWTYSPLFV